MHRPMDLHHTGHDGDFIEMALEIREILGDAQIQADTVRLRPFPDYVWKQNPLAFTLREVYQ